MRPLAFIHVPKTGGLSLRTLFARYFDPSEICPALEAREFAFFGEGASRYRLFYGHILAAQAERLVPGDAVRFTVFRDPAERLVSYFHYWMRPGHVPRADYPPEERAMLAREGVGRFIADPGLVLRRNCAEGVTRQFGFGLERLDPHGPLPSLEPGERRAVLGRALTRLAETHVVGLHERYRESLQLLAYTMGWPAIRHVPHTNARKDGERRALSGEERAALLANESCDVAMYGAARRIFETRYREMVEDLAARYGGEAAGCDQVDAWLDRRHAEGVRADPGRTVPFAAASDPVFHDSWHVPEWSEMGGWARWSGAEGAWVDLRTGGAGRRRLVARVVHLHPESLPLKVEVDGVEVSYRRSDCFGGGFHLEADFVAAGPVARIVFRVAKTWSPARAGGSVDDRELGVLIRWVVVRKPGWDEGEEGGESACQRVPGSALSPA